MAQSYQIRTHNVLYKCVGPCETIRNSAINEPIIITMIVGAQPNPQTRSIQVVPTMGPCCPLCYKDLKLVEEAPKDEKDPGLIKGVAVPKKTGLKVS